MAASAQPLRLHAPRHRIRRSLLVLVALAAQSALIGALVPAHSLPRPAGLAWLQRRLDRGGGRIFLPRLAGGRCYQTPGLWLSHGHTTISSNGACLTVVAAGPVRLRSADGDPIAASAAFFVAHRTATAPPPSDVSISNLQIHVDAPGVDGVDVYADHVHLSQIRVDGSPFDDVYIGGRTNLSGASRQVSIDDSTLLDAERNGISLTAAVDVRITDTTIAGAGGSSGTAADPGDGIDVEPNAPGNPIRDIQIAGNRIVGNIHQAIALRLAPTGRPTVDADRIVITDNTIVGNQPYGGGTQIAIGGGQAGTPTRILLAGNRFGPADLPLCRAPGNQQLTLIGNRTSTGGPIQDAVMRRAGRC